MMASQSTGVDLQHDNYYRKVGRATLARLNMRVGVPGPDAGGDTRTTESLFWPLVGLGRFERNSVTGSSYLTSVVRNVLSPSRFVVLEGTPAAVPGLQILV